MKYLLHTVFVVLIFFPIKSYSTESNINPNLDFKIITSDLDRFKKVVNQWQLHNTVDNTQLLQQNYLANASLGLNDFYRVKIKSIDKMVETIDMRLSYFQALDFYNYNPKSLYPQLAKMFHQFSQWTADAKPMNVYFVVGRQSSAGTVSKNGILIGVEHYTKQIPTDELSQAYKFITFDSIAASVAHEYVHSLQHQAGPATLVRAAIFEGGADFLAELSTGISPLIKRDAYRFGLAHEKLVWDRFKKSMASTDVSNWIANKKQDNWPADMGYYVGYQIAKAFYQNMDDKQEAFKHLTWVSDPEYILKIGQYEKSLNRMK